MRCLTSLTTYNINAKTS